MQYQELSWRSRGRLWMRLAVRLLLFVAAALLLFLVGVPLLSLCMPFVLALIFTWIFEPLVRFLDAKHILPRKALSIILILLLCSLLGGLLFLVGYQLFQELSALSLNWQTVWGQITQAVEQFTASASRLLNFFPEDIRVAAGQASAKLMDWLADVGTTTLLPKTTSFAASIPGGFLSLLFFLMGTYFIMSDYPRISATVTGWMPVNVKAFFRFLLRTFQAAFNGYIRAQLLLSLGVFAILAVSFTLMRVPYGLLLALLLGVMDFIPIIGAGTVMVPWALVELVMGDWRTALLLMVVWGIIVIFRRTMEPRFLGSQTGLHPVLSLLGIFVGMRCFGLLGMVLGPMVLLVIMNVCASGVFDGLVSDVSLAFGDLMAMLGGWRTDRAQYKAQQTQDEAAEPPGPPEPLEELPPGAVKGKKSK